MKTFFLVLVMVFIANAISAVQPSRKPFIQIKIDGKSIRNNDILTVTPGQNLSISVEMEGGRRDFCKFPDTYADITGTAQILSRGKDGLTYQLNDTKAEWKILSEEISFSSGDNIKVNTTSDKLVANINISNEKFSQSFVKVNIKSTWQFSQEGKTSLEENNAEGTIYFKIAGASDVWFISPNIEASGIKNELVLEKLNQCQSACDSIESNIYKLNFAAVQQAIRNLQITVNAIKSTIDEVKASNPSYQTKVVFIGLPSDHPFQDIDVLTNIKNSWDSQEALVNDLKQQVGKLPEKPTNESKTELVKIISLYVDWLNHLPDNTFKVLINYIPNLNLGFIKVSGNIHNAYTDKTISNYSQTFTDMNTFLDKRIEQLPDEIQKINNIHTRLQAVRLFDGMLRGYFSSITWAEWKSTRGF